MTSTVDIKALVVEDDKDDVIILEKLLKRAKIPYQVTWVKSCAEGVNQAITNHFDICFVDYRLGAETGIEFVQLVKQHTNSLPIVMLTGEESEELGLKAIQAGADDYLTKGEIGVEVLKRTLRYSIERVKLHNQQAELLQLQIEQQAQKREQARILEIYERITDAFFALDKKWRLVYINQHAEPLLHHATDEILGKVIWDVFPEAVNTTFYHQYHQAMDQGRTVHFEEYYLPFKTWYEVTAYPAKEGISVFFRDITEKKLLEQQKEDFLGVASHELKTPITSLKAYEQVLTRILQEKGIAQATQLLQKMDDQINKLTNLVTNLLDVTKIHEGKLQLNQDWFNFNQLVEEVVTDMQHIYPEHTIEVHTTDPSSFYGDRDRLGQVLTNLIGNAIKYSPQQKHVIVTIKTQSNSLLCSVKDFGIGIPDEMRHKIFERFYRIDTPHSDTTSGLGLGLYISSQIVKRHQGKITVHSRLNRGSTFTVELPLSTPRPVVD